MRTGELTDFLNNYLKNSEIEDDSQNGLQVGDVNSDINGIAYGVDACSELFEKAAIDKNNFIIVHHGLLWGKSFPLVGYNHDRFKVLFKNDLALYAVHLPLDLNAEIGHNIDIARKLDLVDLDKFGYYHRQYIGFKGSLKEPQDIEAFEKHLYELFPGGIFLKNGKNKIKNIGIVSGGGSDFISEAVEKNIDLFITGEAKHYVYHIAKESSMNVFFGGHYLTERFGLFNLKTIIENKFSIPGKFYDIPTGF